MFLVGLIEKSRVELRKLSNPFEAESWTNFQFPEGFINGLLAIARLSQCFRASQYSNQ